jgi:hypothetical protein
MAMAMVMVMAMHNDIPGPALSLHQPRRRRLLGRRRLRLCLALALHPRVPQLAQRWTPRGRHPCCLHERASRVHGRTLRLRPTARCEWSAGTIRRIINYHPHVERFMGIHQSSQWRLRGVEVKMSSFSSLICWIWISILIMNIDLSWSLLSSSDSPSSLNVYTQSVKCFSLVP